MTLYKGADAAFPGSPLPPGTKILAAYVGQPGLGAPDTPHIWTPAEWNQYLDPDSRLYGGPDLRVLPIYTHDYPGDPVADGNDAVAAVRQLGWDEDIGRLILWDAETLVDPGYAIALYNTVAAGGFVCAKYGSLAFTFQNPPAPGGTVLADYNYQYPPKQLPPGTVGLQWRPGQTWDSDVFSQYVYDNCGRGLRHG